MLIPVFTIQYITAVYSAVPAFVIDDDDVQLAMNSPDNNISTLAINSTINIGILIQEDSPTEFSEASDLRPRAVPITTTQNSARAHAARTASDRGGGADTESGSMWSLIPKTVH
jgi:hypothetical protein